MESALHELIAEGRPDDEVSAIARLRPDGLIPPEMRVIARFGRIVTFRAPRAAIERIYPLMESIKRPQQYTFNLEDGDETGVDPHGNGDDLPGGEEDADVDETPLPGDRRREPGWPTGKGVIVAHLDWGLDFTHPAFRNPDGSTRLLALWDQGADYDPARPNRYGIGRIHDRDGINRALRQRDPLSALGYRWWMSDRKAGSHGTSTLGISAGSVVEGGEPGMAPEADLIFVDLTTRTPQGLRPLGDSTDLIEGCDFILRVARDRHVVINASLGRQAGQHDGLTLTEQAFDAMLAERPGRAMTMSCGNYYARAAHAQTTLDPGEQHDFVLELAPGERRSEVDLWYPRADRLSLSVRGPGGVHAGPVTGDDRADILLDGRVVGRLYNRRDDPNNGDSQASLFLHRDAPVGAWTLTVHGDAVGDGRLHAWVERSPAGPARLRFAAGDDDPTCTVGTICNGFRTIAVAAYDAHSTTREPGAFSSSGPTRDGRTNRPGIAAPGKGVLSARSTPRDRSPAPLYSRMSGTSMAAPYVAGTIALMFAAARRPLTIDETRDALFASAEPVPEALRLRFGVGYCAPAAAIARAAAIHGPPSAVPAVPTEPRRLVPITDREDITMDEFEDHTDQPDEDFECCADSEAEDQAADEAASAPLGEGDDETMLPVMEGEEAAGDEQGEDFDAEWQPEAQRRRRRDGFGGGLPFQFQIPVGGSGGLGLGIPIGGRSSPFALSVPLSAPAAPQPQPPAPYPPQPYPAPPYGAQPYAGQPYVGQPYAGQPYAGQPVAPAAPVMPGEPPVTTALDLPPDPGDMAAAAQAAADAGEFDVAEDETNAHFAAREAEDQAALAEALALDTLERSFMPDPTGEWDARHATERMMAEVAGAGRFGSSAEMLSGLGAALVEDDAETDDNPTLGQLFHGIADGSVPAPRLFGRDVRVLLRPGQPIGDVTPRRGDMLLRAIPGQGWVQASFVASDGIVAGADAAALGMRAETDPLPMSGGFVHVAELWPVRRTEDDRFLRRLTTGAGLTAADTLLLRLGPGADAETLDESEPVTALTPGTSGPAVAGLQRRLNLLHAGRTARGLAGLPDMPLAEDGRYGPRLRAAVAALQRLAPAGLMRHVDGVAGPATLNALALLEAALALVSPAAPAAPAHGSRGGIAAGELVEDRLPLLASHRGTQPDLVLRWNAMPAAPERVDVVVHLHGFSGRRAAMRIDRDKLPASGLDFADPDAPGSAGRSRPTLAILPRGNFYGGRSGIGYDFPALLRQGALEQLIRQSLALFARANGLAPVAAGRLILTAHSGGGAPLMRLLADHDPDEVFCFDALYGDPAPLIRWAEARLRGPTAGQSALRVLYRAAEGTASHSAAVARALAPLTASDPDLGRRWRADAVRQAHNDIPRHYGWRLLADAAADVVPTPRQHAGSEADDEARFVDAAEQAAPASGLDQPRIDLLASREFDNAAELQRWFAADGGFADWFNRNLAGQGPFTRYGRSALRMPTGAAPRARFDAFWDRLALAYGQDRISLLEFAALMAIVLNETDGDFAGRTESSGRGGAGRTDARGPHRGLAYFFDRIELRPGHFKASYNHLSGGRTAGSLFDDPRYIRAHRGLGGADRFANNGAGLNGAWNGHFYPQDQVPTDEHGAATAFIREADFYKFRGRGIIQTTGRASYVRHVGYVQGYTGADPVILGLRRAWSGVSADEACTLSTNDQWEQWFALPDTLALGLRFHAGPHGYQHMARSAGMLNALPAARGRPPNGAIATMGQRISGSRAYGAGIYRDRVLALMGAMAALATASPPRPAAQPPAPNPGQELEHRQNRRTADRPAGGSPARAPVAPPSAENARAQWDASPRAHGYFNNSFDIYLGFVPAFAARGVGDAAGYLARNMTRLTFFGRRQDGHRDLAGPLAAAEAALAGRSLDPPVTRFGCLNVRFIAGTQRLSFHGLGRAVDLNSPSNPHVKRASDFLVIQTLTGADLRRETDPARLRDLSAQFQRGFTPEWRAAQTDRAVIRALADRDTRTRLDGYARRGFCTLDPALVRALMAAGLRWGGSWSSSKDFMHFELPPGTA